VRRSDGEYEEAVHLTRDLLRGRARLDKNHPDALVTYAQLSEYLVGHGVTVPCHGGLMPEILADVSRQEAAEGRGLISALVVKQDTLRPSYGFYRFARTEFGRTGADMDLWIGECDRVRSEHGAGSATGVG
jgi:hypothetical protein